jgi:hypothetical protein
MNKVKILQFSWGASNAPISLMEEDIQNYLSNGYTIKSVVEQTKVDSGEFSILVFLEKFEAINLPNN